MRGPTPAWALLLLLFSVIRDGQTRDCEVQEYSRLNLTNPNAINVDLFYESHIKSIGLSLFYISSLNVKPSDVDATFSEWKTKSAATICRSENNQINSETFNGNLMNLLGSDNEKGLFLDIRIIKHEEVKNEDGVVTHHAGISCQLQLPSPQLHDKSHCQKILNLISGRAGITQTEIDDLSLASGLNDVFLTLRGFRTQIAKPTTTICRSSRSQLTREVQSLSTLVDHHIDQMTTLDSSLGSSFIPLLEHVAVSCNYDSFKHMLESDPEPSL